MTPLALIESFYEQVPLKSDSRKLKLSSPFPSPHTCQSHNSIPQKFKSEIINTISRIYPKIKIKRIFKTRSTCKLRCNHSQYNSKTIFCSHNTTATQYVAPTIQQQHNMLLPQYNSNTICCSHNTTATQYVAPTIQQ